MNKPDYNLWSELDLGEHNPDPGGGILYALYYESDQLRDHQTRLIDSLAQIGCSICEQEDGLQIDISKIDQNDQDGVIFLLEELSVTNTALMHVEDGATPMPLEKFIAELKNAFFVGLMQTRPDLPTLYNYVDQELPNLVTGILTTHERSGTLTPESEKAVRELGEFATYQVKKLNRGVVYFKS